MRMRRIRRIILLALFIVVVLVGCNESMIPKEQEMIHAQSVKIPYTEDYIHHVEENEYVISDRNGRVKKYCKSVDSAESITGEDSTSVRAESGIYIYTTPAVVGDPCPNWWNQDPLRAITTNQGNKETLKNIKAEWTNRDNLEMI